MAKIVTWELQGFRDLLGRFRAASPEARKAAQVMSRDIGRLIVAEMKKFAPVGTHYIIHDNNSVTVTKPATLKKSISFRSFNRPWGVELRFYAAEHVKYVVNKTKPHWIEAKNAKVLRFYWPDAPAPVVEMFGGNIVYFKRVWHPGTYANPFPERALISLAPQLQHHAQRAVIKVKETIEY